MWRNKEKRAQSLGFLSSSKRYSKEISEKKFKKEINNLIKDDVHSWLFLNSVTITKQNGS